LLLDLSAGRMEPDFDWEVRVIGYSGLTRSDPPVDLR
jgi:hypothetical protein